MSTRYFIGGLVMNLPSPGISRLIPILALVLTLGIIVSAMTPAAKTQTPQDLTPYTRRVFQGISEVYRMGGEAPESVSKLNTAIDLIEEARLKRTEGEETTALRLERQAYNLLYSIEASDIPAAQKKAANASATRTLMTFLSIIIVVTSSTLVFYAGLRTWHWYDKTKLFEMRIVEKKKDKN